MPDIGGYAAYLDSELGVSYPQFLVIFLLSVILAGFPTVGGLMTAWASRHIKVKPLVYRMTNKQMQHKALAEEMLRLRAEAKENIRNRKHTSSANRASAAASGARKADKPVPEGRLW